MPEFTGIDVSKMIRDNLKNDATQIAYISGNKEYAIEIFEYDPLYFVHKPINKEKIEKVFERLIHRLHLQADAFTYKTGHNIVKIPIKDIIYFESEDHQIIIHYYTQNEYHLWLVGSCAKTIKIFSVFTYSQNISSSSLICA